MHGEPRREAACGRASFFSRLSTAVRHSTTLRRTRAGARARKLRAGGAVGHTAGGERASPAQTPSRPAQGNAFSLLTMVFTEELALVATETTVPRGPVSSAGKLGCCCGVQRLLPGLLRDCDRRAGGTRGGEEGHHQEPGPHAGDGGEEEEAGIPPELCWTIAVAVVCSESLARAVT